MRLKTLYIKNFRCYEDLIQIGFGDITTFIGKNDIGKSTIMDALEIFFNNEAVKIDPTDCNIHSEERKVEIICDFQNLPDEIILDSGARTNLKDEYLLIEDDTLRIKKVYDCSKTKVTCEIYIVAKHPTKVGYEDILSKKESELQKMVKNISENGPLKGNPSMRQYIYNSVEDLQLQKVDIPISKIKADAKDIWAKIEAWLPTYALFQSDRNSQDSDGEVQNPMKAAIQEAISEVQGDIDDIQKKITEKAVAIANDTHKALMKIDPNLARQLKPKFSSPAPSKWNSLYSISMDTDEGIALNKRGSGVRRMILVGFFKAEAERKAKKSSKRDVIYAIEEPETAQHPNNQKILIDSFKKLSDDDHCQVIVTTHSPALAQELPTKSLRFVDRDDIGTPTIQDGSDKVLEKIVDTLGVFANPYKANRVKVVLCVEGPTDVIAMNALCRCLREKDSSVIDIDKDERVIVMPLGGSTLKYWVEQRYLSKLNIPEVHIYDNDVKHYKTTIDEVNSREDGSWGVLTKKYEIENYLSADAINDIYGVQVDTSQPNVPKKFGIEYSKKQNYDGTMKDASSKKMLSKVFEKGMNYTRLEEIGAVEEVKSWFERIKELAEK